MTDIATRKRVTAASLGDIMRLVLAQITGAETEAELDAIGARIEAIDRAARETAPQVMPITE